MTGNVSMEVLAKQCGTSIQMLEQHYSHMIPKMFTKELVLILVQSQREKRLNLRIQQKIINMLKEWEVEYTRRGGI